MQLCVCMKVPGGGGPLYADRAQIFCSPLLLVGDVLSSACRQHYIIRCPSSARSFQVVPWFWWCSDIVHVRRQGRAALGFLLAAQPGFLRKESACALQSQAASDAPWTVDGRLWLVSVGGHIILCALQPPHSCKLCPVFPCHPGCGVDGACCNHKQTVLVAQGVPALYVCCTKCTGCMCERL